MKKINFLAIAVAFASIEVEVNAQVLYVPSGTEGIGSSTVTGNVGIGTANPAQKLKL